MRFAMNAHTEANGGIESARNETTLDVREHLAVLIVGGGPSGLLQAYLLARLGVKSLVIEKYPQRLAAPKAHALSPRSLEICRQFGIDVNKLRSIGSQRADAFWVNFVTTLDGEHVGKLPYERMDTAVLDATPEMIHNIPQPFFEQFITQELTKTNLVEIRKGTAFVACSQTDDHVLATVEERGTNTRYLIRARYLIACDGAKSQVREFLKVESEGEDSYETMMTIHFHADLRPVVGANVGILHWIMDPEVSGFIIAYDLGGNQVLICNFDPKRHPVNSWNKELCLHTLKVAIGKHTEIDVVSWRPWILSRKVANQYRVGNVFLAGDAAHSFPPTGGLGLNSGLADVHNLAYRIAANLQGWGGNVLLDSYEFERRHVAQVNSQQSVKNGKKIFGLLKALGTTEKNVATSRQNLFHALRDVEQRKNIDMQISEQQEHFDNLELHIGYVYGSNSIPDHASHYTPKYLPGARLPHAWIEPLNTTLVSNITPADLRYVAELDDSELASRRYSTLDLCAFNSLTLLQSNTPFSTVRSNAALRLLDSDAALGPASPSLGPIMRVVSLGKDFRMSDAVRHDDGGQHDFCAQLGLGDGEEGGVLVRPDQHILMRLYRETTAEDIVKAIREHLFGGV